MFADFPYSRLALMKDEPYRNAVYIPKRSQQIKSKRRRAKKKKRGKK